MSVDDNPSLNGCAIFALIVLCLLFPPALPVVLIGLVCALCYYVGKVKP